MSSSDRGLLPARIEELTGSAVVTMSSVAGGDFATAYRVELVDRRVVFVKTHTDPPPGFFTTEAAGLKWLAEPGVINVANVVAVTDDAPACLVLDWIDLGGGRRNGEGDASFGRALASLHKAGAPAFGREDRSTTGSLALPNDGCESWAEFYREQRLQPLAEIAATRGSLPTATIDRLSEVADRLAEFGGTDEPPARLHGDLWSGNRVIDRAGESWLVDPAAHGGHREFDLAMMALFGGFGERAFDSYDDEFPLIDGWQQRVPLHQLAPLVVHAIKFGGGYVSGVEAALSALGWLGGSDLRAR